MIQFPEEKKDNGTTIIVVLLFTVVGAAAYYLVVMLRKPKDITLYGSNDTLVNGTYTLLEEETSVRKRYTEHNKGKTANDPAYLTTPSSARNWENLVWQHKANKKTFIYDHQTMPDGSHVWSIGPWSQKDGGEIFQNRYAYLWVSKATYDSKVPQHKKKQTFGLKLSETLNPVQPHDVMQFASFTSGWGDGPSRGWAYNIWPTEAEKTVVGSVRLA